MACTSVRPRCAAAADLDRDALFREHLDWAAAIARNVHRKLPPSFELDDLTQFAHMELWKRARLYDPERNDSFQGFAYLPIRGAVLMSCRRRHYREATHVSLHTPSRSTPSLDDEIDHRLNPEAALLACERTDAERASLVQFLDSAADSAPEAAQMARLVLLEGVPAATLAARYGVTEIAMARRISRTIRTLRKVRETGADRGAVLSGVHPARKIVGDVLLAEEPA